MRVQDIMDRDYPSLYADELATKARAILRSQGLRFLPIVDEHKRLIGIISHVDIDQAARLMQEKNVGALPLVENERLVGIITERDFFKLIAS